MTFVEPIRLQTTSRRRDPVVPDESEFQQEHECVSNMKVVTSIRVIQIEVESGETCLSTPNFSRHQLEFRNDHVERWTNSFRAITWHKLLQSKPTIVTKPVKSWACHGLGCPFRGCYLADSSLPTDVLARNHAITGSVW